MNEILETVDEFGPEKILHIANPRVGLKAIVVVDNTALGPSIGGVRMAPDVTLEECTRLARAMTRKNAAACLPHGGGKAVIFGDSGMPRNQKEGLVRCFAQAIRDLVDYVPGPDMGTNETCMAWVRDEIGRAVGLPQVIGGIPLDDIGATGFGLAVAAEVAEELGYTKLSGSRVAVQGFGAVGRHAAAHLAKRGARLVAAADSKGTVIDPNGLDLETLLSLKADGESVTALESAAVLDREAVLSADCDILIPAARPDAIHVGNVGNVTAKVVLQGANIPATAEAEEELHRRDVVVIPDFIANAGGVICASVEYRNGSEADAMAAIGERIAGNTRATLIEARNTGLTARMAANAIAERRLRTATSLRRQF